MFILVIFISFISFLAHSNESAVNVDDSASDKTQTQDDHCHEQFSQSCNKCMSKRIVDLKQVLGIKNETELESVEMIKARILSTTDDGKMKICCGFWTVRDCCIELSKRIAHCIDHLKTIQDALTTDAQKHLSIIQDDSDLKGICSPKYDDGSVNCDKYKQQFNTYYSQLKSNSTSSTLNRKHFMSIYLYAGISIIYFINYLNLKNCKHF